MKVPCKNIPFYDLNKKIWSTKSFEDQFEFGKFLFDNCFKEPGKYEFDSSFTNYHWVKLGLEFNREGRYTSLSEDTQDYIDFWEEEEMKCRKGVLWLYKDRWYYTTRDYYFMLNYFRIVNKEKDLEESFMTARDGQYHMMLYIKLAEIYHQNSCILKRRQFAFSNCLVAKSINYLFFENNKRIKWFASDDKYIDAINGSWYMLNIAKKHLNLHTGWYKDFTPDKSGEIMQRVQVKESKGSGWHYEGNESSIIANTMKKDPAAGVGGASYFCWYEEGGIAPTADETYGFIDFALLSGGKRVGSFCIGGSVGDLDQCAPLKKYTLNPETNGFLGIPTEFYSPDGEKRTCGLFIPAQYCMPEATDEHGNSLVDIALYILDKSEKEGWKTGDRKGNSLVVKDEVAWSKREEKDYILMKSQNPRYITEAFAYRNTAFFNVALSEKRQNVLDILDKENRRFKKQGLFVDGKFIDRKMLKHPSQEMIHPVDPKLTDKRGLVNIYEEYNPEFYYYAGIDNVDAEITTTSESLFSISIYRRSYIVYDKTTGKQSIIHGRVMANWTGRFDSTDETNEHALQLLKMYNAKACAERNKPNFINHCKRTGNSKYLALASELPFDKDIDVSGKDNGQYGVWRDSAGKVMRELLRVGKEYLNSERDVIYLDVKEDTDEIGKIKKIVRGYDEMDDYWTIEEFKKYNPDDGNYDRLDATLYAIHYGTAEELSFKDKIVMTESKPNDRKYIEPKKIAPRNLLFQGNKQTKYNDIKKRSLLNY